MIYLIVNEHHTYEFENRKKFYTDLVPDLHQYLSRIGHRGLVPACDYVFRIINGKTFYLKDRMCTNYQYTEEDLVALRLSATKL